MKCVHGVFFNRYCRQCDLGDDDLTQPNVHPHVESTTTATDSLLCAKVKFGLRKQGHLSTVGTMLAYHKTWEEIGEAIGWGGETAKIYWLREMESIQ